MASSLNIITIRSAFCTPVIACASQFLADEGLESSLQFVQGHNVIAEIREGRIDMAQSAPSNSMVALSWGTRARPFILLPSTTETAFTS